MITLLNDPVKSAHANVEVMPGDAITASRTPIVSLMGEVTNRAETVD